VASKGCERFASQSSEFPRDMIFTLCAKASSGVLSAISRAINLGVVFYLRMRLFCEKLCVPVYLFALIKYSYF
jgi:hypothetical protein